MRIGNAVASVSWKKKKKSLSHDPMRSLLPSPPSRGPRNISWDVHQSWERALAGLAAVCRSPGVITLHSLSLTNLLTSYSERATFPVGHPKQQDGERREEREEILPVPGSTLGTLHHNLMIFPFLTDEENEA